MKRIISCALLLAMLLAMLAGCNTPSAPTATTPVTEATPVETQAPADDNLAAAIAYLKNIYKNVPAMTPADFERVAVVPVGTAKYDVVWSVDVSEDQVKVVPGTGMVTIDVNDTTEVEINYVLTATLTGTDGRTESLSWNHNVPASLGSDFGAIVDMGYALEEGQAMPTNATLTGVITSIDTPYSPDYKNITVTIQIEGREDKPIMCYRLKGDGADTLMPGDTITVTGILKNYKGTIEFDAGCTLDKVVKGENSEIPTDPADIMKAAYELAPGKALPYTVTLSGRVYAVNNGFDSRYNNITVSIHVDGSGKSLMCYRMKGDAIRELNIGDIITVTGNIKNYKGTIELDTGCKLLSIENHPEPTGPKDFADVLEAAKKVQNKHYLPYATIRTGVVTSVPKYNSKYDSYTFYANIEGHNTYFYSVEFCDGGVPEKGDTIKVKGHMTAYNGSPQFDHVVTMWLIAKGEGGGTEPEGTEPPAPATLAEQLAEANKLQNNDYLPYTTTITGTVSVINTAYSEQYKNITITVDVDGTGVYCYRIKGTGVDKLAVGDKIKISGKLTAYNGKAQFDSTATVTILGSDGTEPEATQPTTPPNVNANSTPAEVLAAAAALKEGASLNFTYTLTGKIQTSYGYNASFGNITVIMATGDTTVQCYRLKGTGVDQIDVGDTITVTGVLGKNTSGYIRFNEGCTLVSFTKGEPEATEPTTPPVAGSLAAQIAAAGKLENGKYLDEESTITGTITNTPKASSYNEGQYDFTVSDGTNTVRCYFVPVTGGTPAKGDTVTVTGKLTAYNGSAQFDKTAKATLSKASEPEATEPKPTEPKPTEPKPTEPKPTEPAKPGTLAEQIAEANKLANNAHLTYTSTITGTITNDPKESSYSAGSYDFTVTDGTNTIRCYYVPVTGGTPTKGATVTVTGKLTAYNGKAQFDSSAKATLGASEPEVTEPKPTEPAATEPAKPTSLAKQIAAAGKLENGKYLDVTSTITGTISNAPKASSYNEGQYDFTVSDGTNTVRCYYVPVTGGTPAKGDTVTVTGKLTAYNGTAQFDKTATAVLSKSSQPEATEPTTPPSVNASSPFADVAAAAKALGNSNYLSFEYTITGTIKAAYNNNNGTYNVPIITSEGQVNCNNMTGDAAAMAALAAGDTISVKGKLGLNSKGVLAFSGCVLVSHTPAEGGSEPEATEPTVTVPGSLAEQIAEAGKLANKQYLSYTSTITGTITNDPKASSYNEGQYNFYVSNGSISIQCYYVVVNGGVPAKGDTVTVTGCLTAYNGTAQFDSKSTATLG